MKLRILFAILGLVLAGVGVLAVNIYARAADERAMRDQQPVEVLVLAQDVPAGTTSESLGEFVETKELPRTAVAVGAVTTLEGLEGRVTSVDLVTGEQLLISRMVPPETLEEPGRVDVPAGLQEITVRLSAERLVGAGIVAGDTVGVIMSNEAQQTHMRLQRVLVTTLQGIESPGEAESEEAEAVSAGSYDVTLAVTAPDAELLANASEFGSIWLTLQPADADPNGTRIVTPDQLVQ